LRCWVLGGIGNDKLATSCKGQLSLGKQRDRVRPGTYLLLRSSTSMPSDRKEIRPELARRILQRLARELELANAVLDEWDQDRVLTKVSACR
jgi:hypothetical protein